MSKDRHHTDNADAQDGVAEQSVFEDRRYPGFDIQTRNRGIDRDDKPQQRYKNHQDMGLVGNGHKPLVMDKHAEKGGV